MDGRFRRRVAGHMGKRTQAFPTGDVNHAPPSSAGHVGYERLNQAHARDHIQLVIPGPRVSGAVEPGVLGIHGGVADKDVDCTERCLRLRRKPRDVGRNCEIGGDEYCVPTGACQVVDETPSALLITAVNHHVYIFQGELAHDRRTDAGGAAGHERSLSGEAKIHERWLSNDLNVERRRAQPFPHR
jgi:hypothetical protein